MLNMQERLGSLLGAELADSKRRARDLEKENQACNARLETVEQQLGETLQLVLGSMCLQESGRATAPPHLLPNHPPKEGPSNQPDWNMEIKNLRSEILVLKQSTNHGLSKLSRTYWEACTLLMTYILGKSQISEDPTEMEVRMTLSPAFGLTLTTQAVVILPSACSPVFTRYAV
jgi:hypothetical protein